MRSASEKPAYAFKIHRCALPTSSSSLCLSLSHFILFSVTVCLPIFSPYVSHPSLTVSIRVPSSLTAGGAILCHFVSFFRCFIFSPCVPFFSATIKPFHALKFPRPPPRSLLLFPSVYLLRSSSPRPLFPLPPSLFCSPAAHKNSSFFSPEDCSVA